MTETTTAPTRLEETVARLAHRVDVLEAELAVRRLQHQYGYYLDKCLYAEVVDLFSDDGEVVFCGGLYRGRAGIRRLYIERFQARFTQGRGGPVHGFLLDHPQLQDVVTVGADATTAHGRFRCLMQAGVHASVRDEAAVRTAYDQWWEGALYENEYVRENGVWKIKRLDYRPLWHAEYGKGWAETPPMNAVLPTVTFPEDPVGPDAIVPGFALFPATDVVAFHYDHPVTGQAWTP